MTETAAGAIRLAEETAPDLVMLDLALPDGDGRDVCRELRRHSNVPIVMLTARGTEMDKIVGLELGADDYVVKPFSAAEVISRIRAVLRRSGDRQSPNMEPLKAGDWSSTRPPAWPSCGEPSSTSPARSSTFSPS